MDTVTHFVMGIGLFGLAHLDPAIGANPDTSQAVLLGTVIGSQMPDSDTIFRFRGNATYIRQHRGFSHSLPMLSIWPSFITAGLHLFWPNADMVHLWWWTFLAVFIHIFIDLFNSYGTQAGRPFTNKWIAFHTLAIFDPFIFAIHLIGFLLWWLFPNQVGFHFLTIYVAIAVYIAIRIWIRRRLTLAVQRDRNRNGRYTLIPTGNWFHWKVIAEFAEEVHLGEIRNQQLLWIGRISTKGLQHPATLHSKKAEPIKAFLDFTSYGYPEVRKRAYGYEVRWLDVRYHSKKHFPFLAVALLDHEYNIIYSFVGWINQEQLDKKVKQSLQSS
ncbi:metal-dependent hydrolase [Laceyella sacchari]|uniref:Metal-dependent hydrolase n=1 Tax=Laceyella sacchari TaxID=37482 RepID=A0ABY5U7G1_LACSH|nr:metal-dependent hydrolase [Laceyella sacchari]UWE03978.1 metal-dependent hydrolase [Laceyella sacchari]